MERKINENVIQFTGTEENGNESDIDSANNNFNHNNCKVMATCKLFLKEKNPRDVNKWNRHNKHSIINVEHNTRRIDQNDAGFNIIGHEDIRDQQILKRTIDIFLPLSHPKPKYKILFYSVFFQIQIPEKYTNDKTITFQRSFPTGAFKDHLLNDLAEQVGNDNKKTLVVLVDTLNKHNNNVDDQIIRNEEEEALNEIDNALINDNYHNLLYSLLRVSMFFLL